jgi:hypothetical protein
MAALYGINSGSHERVRNKQAENAGKVPSKLLD